MKKRITISSRQMATLFLSFLTGSAIVNIPAPITGAAKNAAWISLWMANRLGMLLLSCILYLYRKYPRNDAHPAQSAGRWKSFDYYFSHSLLFVNLRYAFQYRGGHRRIFQKYDDEGNANLCFSFFNPFHSGTDGSFRY